MLLARVTLEGREFTAVLIDSEDALNVEVMKNVIRGLSSLKSIYPWFYSLKIAKDFAANLAQNVKGRNVIVEDEQIRRCLVGAELFEFSKKRGNVTVKIG